MSDFVKNSSTNTLGLVAKPKFTLPAHLVAQVDATKKQQSPAGNRLSSVSESPETSAIQNITAVVANFIESAVAQPAVSESEVSTTSGMFTPSHQLFASFCEAAVYLYRLGKVDPSVKTIFQLI